MLEKILEKLRIFVGGEKVEPCMLGDLFFRIKQYFTHMCNSIFLSTLVL